MAIFSTRADQSANVAHTLGNPHHGNRISFRVCCRILLYFPSLALLDQSRHRDNFYGVCCDTWSKKISVS